MKRSEIWLAVIVGIFLGVIAHSFFTHGSRTGNARDLPLAKATDSGPATTAAAAGETPNAETPANTWVRRSPTGFDAAVPNQPTPGIVDAISDALRADAPFDQARMLMLIELMRAQAQEGTAHYEVIANQFLLVA